MKRVYRSNCAPQVFLPTIDLQDKKKKATNWTDVFQIKQTYIQTKGTHCSREISWNYLRKLSQGREILHINFKISLIFFNWNNCDLSRKDIHMSTQQEYCCIIKENCIFVKAKFIRCISNIFDFTSWLQAHVTTWTGDRHWTCVWGIHLVRLNSSPIETND